MYNSFRDEKNRSDGSCNIKCNHGIVKSYDPTYLSVNISYCISKVNHFYLDFFT